MTNQTIQKIKHLAFYPVKSISGVELSTATLTKDGLVLGNYKDHQFMIVRAEADSSGIYNFITQRDKRIKNNHSQPLFELALIKLKFIGQLLQLTYQNKSSISLPYDITSGKNLPVKIWDDICFAVDQGNELAHWFSDILNFSVRIVKADLTFNRKCKQNYFSNSNSIRFQDAYPVHWFAIESVDELSQVAEQNIPWQTFRPQIVTCGTEPQFEHKIYSGKISGIPFVNAKPCDRCSVTLINQKTGEVRKNEPLASLSKYKNWKNNDGNYKVIFGENMIPLECGTISVNDEITSINFRNPPLVYGKNV